MSWFGNLFGGGSNSSSDQSIVSTEATKKKEVEERPPVAARLSKRTVVWLNSWSAGLSPEAREANVKATEADEATLYNVFNKGEEAVFGKGKQLGHTVGHAAGHAIAIDLAEAQLPKMIEDATGAAREKERELRSMLAETQARQRVLEMRLKETENTRVLHAHRQGQEKAQNEFPPEHVDVTNDQAKESQVHAECFKLQQNLVQCYEKAIAQRDHEGKFPAECTASSSEYHTCLARHKKKVIWP